MTLSDKLAAALRECEEACPCVMCLSHCGECQCQCTPKSLRPDPLRTDICLWVGHAAIARYGDLRALQGRVEQASRDAQIADDRNDHACFTDVTCGKPECFIRHDIAQEITRLRDADK